MKNNYFAKIFILLIIILFSFYGSAFQVVIDGGSFETGDPPDSWANAVCGKLATPPIAININWDGKGTFIRDISGATVGTYAGICYAGTTTGVGGHGDPNYICINNGSNKDCIQFSSDNDPFPAEVNTNVSITLTNDYGSDFNVSAYFFESPSDLNFFSMQYGGTTELNTGDIVTLDIEHCKAGGNNCNYGSGVDGGYIAIDNIRTTTTPTIVNTLTAPTTSVGSGENFTVRYTVAYDNNSGNVNNADVNINFNNAGWVASTYSVANSWYEYTFTAPSVVGDYNLAVESFLTGSTGDYDESTVSVIRSEYQYLTITPIENVGSWAYGSVDFIPSNEANTIIWKADSNSASAETPTFNITNSRTDGRQYFIYTSVTNSHYAFNDTLTFGATSGSPLQKIWDDSAEEYVYTFSDTLTAHETKYYKLTYKDPYKYYNSIAGSSEWQIFLTPNVIDLNALSYDEYTVSQYANIRNIFVDPIPNITGDETLAFELQFTGWADVNSTSVCIGETVFSTDTTACGNLTTTPRRFSFTITETDFDSQALMVSINGTSASVNLMDYAIVPRGFFTKRLEQLKPNGDVLNSFLLSGLSSQYTQEGQSFRIKTEVYDREGVINRLELEGYFGDTTANNLVRKSTKFPYEIDALTSTKEESTLTFNELFPPIIDLNGYTGNPASPRNLILKANIYDNNGVVVATQSKTVKFLQYPYFPDDLIINFYPTEKRLGKNPKGLLELKVKYPETLTGLDFRLWDDTNSVSSPDFKTRIYNNKEFNCTSRECSFEILIDEWVFDDLNRNSIQVTAMLNTEYFSLTNRLTHTIRHFWVTPIEFEKARIHQVVERTDDTYRNDEEISLVLGLLDDEATNVSDKLDVYLTLENCDANTGSPFCVSQTTKYKPTGFIYDDQFHTNFYFFRHLFLLDNGALLPDGNHISFNAVVTDKTGVRTASSPILASKCRNKDFKPDYLTQGVGLLLSIFGVNDVFGITDDFCNTKQYDLVTTTTNTDQREYLFIDSSHSTSSPTQEGMVCLTPDSNNLLSKPFEQNLVCFVAYTVGEKPIDEFRLRLTNNFSNLTETGSTKQYLEFNIPYEVIAYNDIKLLEAELKLNQDTKINSIGDFLYYGFRNTVVSNFKFWGLEDNANFILGKGNLQNIGGDFDLTADFNTANIDAGVFFIVKGIPVMNVQSFKSDSRIGEDFDFIDRSNFLNYLAENNINFKEGDTELNFITSSFVSPFKIKSDGILILDAEAQNIQVNRSNVDANTHINYDVMPQTFLFNLSSTMFYNNFSDNDTLTTIIRVFAVITTPPIDAFWQFLGEFGTDPAKAITEGLFQAIIPLSILMGLLLVFAVIYNKFKPNGGGNE